MRVRVLGRCEVERDGRTVALRFRQAELVGLLATRGVPVARATVAGLLWPGVVETMARHNLRQTLVALRGGGVECVTTDGGALKLVDIEVDLWELRNRLKGDFAPEPVDELLPDVRSEWVFPAREEFVQSVVRAALRRGEAVFDADPQRALAYADMALAQDRWLEAVRGLRVRALVALDDRPRAEREIEGFEAETGLTSRLRSLLRDEPFGGLVVGSLNPNERVRALTAAAPGLPAGGRGALARALSAAPHLAVPDRARAEAALANMALEEGDATSAETLARDALARSDEPSAILALARTLIRTGRLDEADRWLAREAEDPESKASFEIARGVVLHLRHALPEAEQTFRRALGLAQDVSCVRLVARARFGLAAVAIWAGRPDAATRELQTGLRELADALPNERARFEMALGRVREDEGRWVEARAAYARAAETTRKRSDPWTLAQALTHLGDLALRRGTSDEATDAYREAIALRRGIGDRLGLATALKGLGQALGSDGEAALREALETYLACGEPLAGAAAHLPLAHLLRDLGRCDEALVHARHAAERLGRMKADPAGLATNDALSPETARALVAELEKLRSPDGVFAKARNPDATLTQSPLS